MNSLWNKVWFDLWRDRGRTALAVLSIAAGVFAIGAIFGMIDQLVTGMDDAHQSVRPSHINIILRDYVDQETVDQLRSSLELSTLTQSINSQYATRSTKPMNGSWARWLCGRIMPHNALICWS